MKSNVPKVSTSRLALAFRHWKRHVFVLLIATVLGLLLAEGLIAYFDWDWRYIKKLLYYQGDLLEVHIPVDDTQLNYRLRPNSNQQGITINSLGARSPERSVKKPDDVFRILCLGGSNVFGVGINDDETWPACLERELQKRTGNNFEVWNYGTSAYVPSQMARLGGIIAKEIKPDLVIYALSNKGLRPFLLGTNIEPYFKQDPSLWEYYFSKENTQFPQWLSYEGHMTLLRHIRFYRLALFAYHANDLMVSPEPKNRREQMNVDQSIAFFKEIRKDSKLCIFIGPAFDPEIFSDYTIDPNIPVFSLSASGKPIEYYENHPPEYVMPWYGQNIADWLIQQNLVPSKTTAK